MLKNPEHKNSLWAIFQCCLGQYVLFPWYLRFMLIFSLFSLFFRNTIFFLQWILCLCLPYHFPSILKPVILILVIFSKLSYISLIQLFEDLVVFVKVKYIYRKLLKS